jgi:HEAT repeat protein
MFGPTHLWKISGQLEDALNNDPDAIPILRDLVMDQDKTIRLAAIRFLVAHGSNARLAAPDLTAALSDADPSVRIQAAAALEKITRNNELGLPVFVEALKIKDHSIRLGAACALPQLGPQDKAAVPVMIEVLREDGTLYPLYRALARAQGAAAVPLLVSTLRDYQKARRAGPPPADPSMDNDWQVAVAAIDGLGFIGPPAESAVSLLTDLLQEKSLRHHAALALWRIEPKSPQIMALLVDMLKNSDNNERRISLSVLSELGPDAKAALPAIAEARKDADKDVRLHAEMVQWIIERQADVVIPVLETAIRSGNTATAQRALHALGDMGPAARNAVPVLVEALCTDDLKYSANYALGQIGADAKSAVPTLKDVFCKVRIEEREMVAQALEKIDPTVDPWQELLIASKRKSARQGTLLGFPWWTWLLAMLMMGAAVWLCVYKRKSKFSRARAIP